MGIEWVKELITQNSFRAKTRKLETLETCSHFTLVRNTSPFNFQYAGRLSYESSIMVLLSC